MLRYSLLNTKYLFHQIKRNFLIFPKKIQKKEIVVPSQTVVNHWTTELKDCKSCMDKIMRTSVLSSIETFKEKYPQILQSIAKDNEINIIKGSTHLEELFNYLTTNRSYSGATLFLGTYKYLEKSENLTDEKLELIYYLASIIDLSFSCVVLLDDIVDGTETRHGMPSWYKQKGLSGIHDALFLEQLAYYIMRQFISKQPNYIHKLHLFFEHSFKVYLGQFLDTSCQTTQSKINFLTQDNLVTCYEHKAGPCFAPIFFAMLMANVDPKIQEHSKKIASMLALLYQAQDDYDDCFASEEPSADITNASCTWLAVTALEKCNSGQRKLFEKYYGTPGSEAQNAIMDLYRELKIPELFYIHRRNSQNCIEKEISNWGWKEGEHIFYWIMHLMKFNN